VRLDVLDKFLLVESDAKATIGMLQASKRVLAMVSFVVPHEEHVRLLAISDGLHTVGMFAKRVFLVVINLYMLPKDLSFVEDLGTATGTRVWRFFLFRP
jgi:hypothetical protein